MTTMSDTKPHIIQIVGYKNTGKTTLTTALIGHFSSMGLKVAAIKHDGHDHFEMDQQGTDSYQFGEAGAAAVVVMSEKRTAIMERKATRLEDMLSHLSGYDWIVIEGFKDASYSKFVMVREEKDLTLVDQLEGVVGIISWLSLEQFKERSIVSDMAWYSVHETQEIAKSLLEMVQSE
ncbi:molybdopterin-guanine dinucleotide biosynthesis protein B [Paenibacillus sp. 1781tsa1]|uniref:molybdopterin-guanine dinucleotide biosynthesis protein B n=1 Tax=Paenibacillus sp. 1781tsa1 TaxID=2953810 RepID=UPI0020A20D41|nr:molybdopterin-guanine dinucleotide biosynthesis protein B [Paenibacillus sp. 1781tsa1]MCP1184818.1 molybdopterin-guanine dinucleotide biosynthesis protein B [Paenibacillus sp. 1781tsa1]